MSKKFNNSAVVIIVAAIAVFVTLFTPVAAHAESTVYSNPNTNVVETYSEQTLVQGGGFVFGLQLYEAKLTGFTPFAFTPALAKQYGYLQISKTKPQLTLHRPEYETVTGAQATYQLTNKYGRFINRYKIINWTTRYPIHMFIKNGALINLVVGLSNSKDPVQGSVPTGM